MKPGDIVRLKSGGPRMTVIRVNDELFECYILAAQRTMRNGKGMVICCWFTKDHQIMDNAFAPSVLTLCKGQT